MDYVLRFKWIILIAVIAVAALVVVIRVRAPQTAAPVVADYYASRDTPNKISAERDLLDEMAGAGGGSFVPGAPGGDAGLVNDGGLMIGPLAGTLRANGAGFSAGQRYPLMSTCYRSNLSPGVSWSDAPAKTKTYAVLFEKIEDAGDPLLYWSLYNIPASRTGIDGNVPKDVGDVAGVGLQGKNHAGNVGYTGPCIPRGEHKFQIRVLALDAVLTIPPGADRAELFKIMTGHIIDMVTMPVIHMYKM